MPNIIDAGGIQIQTFQEILDDIINGTVDVPGLLSIYGSDINVDSNSPDGQLINIFALSKQDILDLIVEDYNSKDPDQAVGVALDAVSQLSGLTRKGGTYTEVVVDVTVNASVNLNGLDNPGQPIFTVADQNGNQFYLELSVALSAGTTPLNFRAVKVGNVQVIPNTVIVPITIQAGVVSVNNPAGPFVQGISQETDAQFRIRRQASVAAPSQGYLQGLYAALNDISGLTSAAVYENFTNNTNPDGIPPHSIWVVVNGGSDIDVATAIYNERTAGAGMFGAESYTITQVDGTPFEVLFDRADTEDLYVELHIDAVNSTVINQAGIAAYLAANYVLGLNQPADVTTVAELVRAYDGNLVVSQAGVSNDGSNFESIVDPSSKENYFILTAGNVIFL